MIRSAKPSPLTSPAEDTEKPAWSLSASPMILKPPTSSATSSRSTGATPKIAERSISSSTSRVAPPWVYSVNRSEPITTPVAPSVQPAPASTASPAPPATTRVLALPARALRPSVMARMSATSSTRVLAPDPARSISSKPRNTVSPITVRSRVTPAPSTRRVSAPLPPSTLRVSVAASKTMVSLPAPPIITSSPAPPSRVSSPRPPMRISSAPVPVRVSLPSVPRKSTCPVKSRPKTT